MAGECFKSNSMTVYCYNPNGLIKADLLLNSKPPSLSKSSSILGMGYASVVVMMLNLSSAHVKGLEWNMHHYLQ